MSDLIDMALQACAIAVLLLGFGVMACAQIGHDRGRGRE